MARSWIAIPFALLIAGCGDPTVEDVCRSYCECAAVLPSQQQACEASCDEQLGGQSLPSGCLECLSEASCEELETRSPCSDACSLDGE